MILFHGSNVPIKAIDLSLSKPNKDFGKAFYLSDNIEQAQKMARVKCVQLGGEPCVTKFSVDEMKMNELCYKRFEKYSDEWARFIFRNRNERDTFSHNYDIVYGPIADDYIGLQMRRFMFSDITFDQFLEEIKYPKGMTFQYAFCTQDAIKLLKLL